MRSYILSILINIMLIVLNTAVANASPRDDLSLLIKRTYPEQWSGRIEWFYTPARNMESDLRDADVRRHDVVYFDSNGLKYVHGSIDFNGSESVSKVYDNQLCISFSPSGVPFLVYPDFNSLGKESTILVYIFMATPEKYKVVKTSDQFIVHDLSGFDVFIDSSTGFVTSAKFGQSEWVFDQHVMVNGCPWATRCKSNFNGNYNTKGSYSYPKIEYQKLTPNFFDYARFYKQNSHDKNGNRIVYLGPQKLLAGDARARDWPNSRDGWNAMMAKNVPNKSTTDSTSRNYSKSNASKASSVSYHTFIWIGVFLIGTGIAGITIFKVRK